MANGHFGSGFAGFLLGVVTGLGIAATAAVFITNSPVPFVEKVQKVTADVDPAQKLAGGVDPNRKLNSQPETAEASAGAVKTVTLPDTDTAAPTKHIFWVQAGAFQSQATADERKALLAMNAIEARVDQAGGLWRVRIGPFANRQAAAEIRSALNGQGIVSTVIQQK